MNINLRFDDWHQASIANLPSDLELLRDNRFDTVGFGLLDHRTHFSTENAF